MTDSAVQRLLDIEAIRELKARYVLLLDSHRYEELRRQFTDDARFVGRNTPLDELDGNSLGPDEWIEAVRKDHHEQLRFHVVSSSIVEILSATTARGLWSFSSSALRGYYDEEYRREDGNWKFSLIEYNVIVPHDPDRLPREAALYDGAIGMLEHLAERWA